MGYEHDKQLLGVPVKQAVEILIMMCQGSQLWSGSILLKVLKGEYQDTSFNVELEHCPVSLCRPSGCVLIPFPVQYDLTIQQIN